MKSNIKLILALFAAIVLIADISAAAASSESPITINNIRTVPGVREVTVLFNTSAPCTAYVSYGLSDKYGGLSNITPEGTEHEIKLTELLTVIKYHLRITAVDEKGNMVNSGDVTFETAVPGYNAEVIKVLKSYPTNGDSRYYWPRKAGEIQYSGTTQNLFYQGERVCKGDGFGRAFCCGLTFEIYFVTWQKYCRDHNLGELSINGMTPDELLQFRRQWYVLEWDGSGAEQAFRRFGVGEPIKDFHKALPGDFINYWRYRNPSNDNKESGHAAILIDWIRTEDNKIVGLDYWSTQGGTNGINYNTEYIGNKDSVRIIKRDNFFIGRAFEPGSERIQKKDFNL